MRLGGLLLPVLVLDLADQPPPSLRMRSGSWLSLRSFAIALSKRSSKFWRPRFRFLIHARIVAVPLDGTGPTFTGHFRSSDSENIRDVKKGEVFVETDTDHNKVVARGIRRVEGDAPGALSLHLHRSIHQCSCRNWVLPGRAPEGRLAGGPRRRGVTGGLRRPDRGPPEPEKRSGSHEDSDERQSPRQQDDL
jgi:hypothetical protein